jgi:hypothetical protein
MASPNAVIPYGIDLISINFIGDARRKDARTFEKLFLKALSITPFL